MSSGFAGSRNLDDRRRRRLATEADDASVSTRPLTDSGRRKKRKSAENERAGTRFPLRKVISRHRWKIWLVGLLLLVPAAGIVFGAFRLESVGRAAGPAVATLLDPAENRLGRAWGSFLLLIASELSILIWWVRSHSPSDFSGRFGVWLWSAGGCFLFSACVATNAHLYFSETVLHFRLVHFPQLGVENTKTLCWLAPAALFGAGIVRSLYLDMRRCWSSVFTLATAVTSWMGAAYLLSQTPSAVKIPHRELAALGSVLLGHVSLLLSLLLHARFVLYESSAPPPESSDRRSLLSLFRVIRRDGETASAEPDAKEETSKKSKSGTRKTTKSTRKPSSRKTPKAADSAEISTSSEDESEEDLEALTRPDSAPPKRDSSVNRSPAAAATPKMSNASSSAATPSNDRNKSTSPPPRSEPKPAPVTARPAVPEEDEDSDDGEEMRLDGPDDRAALKGLSKRERRKLQKQMRDQQRD